MPLRKTASAAAEDDGGTTTPVPAMQIKLRNGRVVDIPPLNLDRFIQVKNVLTRIVRRALEGLPPGSETPQNILLRALEAATADDVLDLMVAVSGYEDREMWREGFRPAHLVQALGNLFLVEGVDLREYLGEAQRSDGPPS